jgi:hypothetical protein
MPMPMEQSEWIMINGERQREEWEKNNKWLYIYTIISYIVLSPVYTTLNFWYGTDKIGTRTTFLVLGLPIFWAPFTLRSIFGTARIKLVPVPLFWFLDYLYFEPHLHYARFLVPYHFFGWYGYRFYPCRTKNWA